MHDSPFFTFTLALLAFALPAAGQTVFEIYPGCTTHSSRSPLGVNPGEILLEVPATHFYGVGHAASGTSAMCNGMRFTTQDQDASTIETFQLVVRTDLAGQPDCTAAGLLLRTGPLTLPGGTGVVAWVMTVNLATPTHIPMCSTFYFGVELAAAPGWSADGQSLHTALYATATNASVIARSLTWSCLNGAAGQLAAKRTVALGLLVDAAVLNMGNVNLAGTSCVGPGPDFGAGGLWPVCEGTTGTMRNDALHVRVRDASLPTAWFGVWAMLGASCPGIPFVPFEGLWYLPLVPPPVWIGGGFLAGGEMVTATLITSPVVKANCALFSQTVDYQGVTWLGTRFRFTNRAATVFGPP